MVTDNEEKENPNFIQVVHRKMVINVLLRLFKGRPSATEQSQASKFKQKLAGRYPWLSSDAIDVIMAEARRARAEQIEKEKTPVQKGKELVSAGRYTEAIRLLDKHLRSHPDDADAWQVRGETLCKAGRTEEDYRSISIGRGKRSKAKRR